MSAPCPTCQPIECFLGDDSLMYSLEAGPFPFVLSCPPGFDCHGATSFSMLCCNQLLTVSIPAGSSAAQVSALIGSVVAQCSTILPFCNGGPPPCNTTPCPPVVVYQNSPQTCSINCPDGTTFVYTVPAGTFGGLDQNTVNQQALAYACQQAGLRRICLSAIPPCTCNGAAYSAKIVETGGVGPFVFSVQSGSLPPGLTLSSTGTISGTTTLQGRYSFTIRCTSTADGSYNQKPYTMTVLTISTATIPAFTTGVPYSFQLQADGGSGNYSWAISLGALPGGLTMSATGLITGTPTGTAGLQPITFAVTDTSCETTQQSFFPPGLTITTKSTTQIGGVVIVGNGSVAANFTTKTTSVVYTLTATNLISGQNYTISVTFYDSVSGRTTKTYSITGDLTGTTVIIDAVPTPTLGHATVVGNPKIVFA